MPDLPGALTEGGTKAGGRSLAVKGLQRRAVRRRRVLPITETEEKLIAAAAIMGLNNNPNDGYKTPAAIGTPIEL